MALRFFNTYSREIEEFEPGDLSARSAMQVGAYFAGVAIEGSML